MSLEAADLLSDLDETITSIVNHLHYVPTAYSTTQQLYTAVLDLAARTTHWGSSARDHLDEPELASCISQTVAHLKGVLPDVASLGEYYGGAPGALNAGESLSLAVSRTASLAELASRKRRPNGPSPSPPLEFERAAVGRAVQLAAHARGGGGAVWLSGAKGSGKTTAAWRVAEALAREGVPEKSTAAPIIYFDMCGHLDSDRRLGRVPVAMRYLIARAGGPVTTPFPSSTALHEVYQYFYSAGNIQSPVVLDNVRLSREELELLIPPPTAAPNDNLEFRNRPKIVIFVSADDSPPPVELPNLIHIRVPPLGEEAFSAAQLAAQSIFPEPSKNIATLSALKELSSATAGHATLFFLTVRTACAMSPDRVAGAVRDALTDGAKGVSLERHDRLLFNVLSQLSPQQAEVLKAAAYFPTPVTVFEVMAAANVGVRHAYGQLEELINMGYLRRTTTHNADGARGDVYALQPSLRYPLSLRTVDRKFTGAQFHYNVLQQYCKRFRWLVLENCVGHSCMAVQCCLAEWANASFAIDQARRFVDTEPTGVDGKAGPEASAIKMCIGYIRASHLYMAGGGSLDDARDGLLQTSLAIADDLRTVAQSTRASDLIQMASEGCLWLALLFLHLGSAGSVSPLPGRTTTNGTFIVLRNVHYPSSSKNPETVRCPRDLPRRDVFQSTRITRAPALVRATLFAKAAKKLAKQLKGTPLSRTGITLLHWATLAVCDARCRMGYLARAIAKVKSVQALASQRGSTSSICNLHLQYCTSCCLLDLGCTLQACAGLAGAVAAARVTTVGVVPRSYAVVHDGRTAATGCQMGVARFIAKCSERLVWGSQQLGRYREGLTHAGECFHLLNPFFDPDSVAGSLNCQSVLISPCQLTLVRCILAYCDLLLELKRYKECIELCISARAAIHPHSESHPSLIIRMARAIIDNHMDMIGIQRAEDVLLSALPLINSLEDWCEFFLALLSILHSQSDPQIELANRLCMQLLCFLSSVSCCPKDVHSGQGDLYIGGETDLLLVDEGLVCPQTYGEYETRFWHWWRDASRKKAAMERTRTLGAPARKLTQKAGRTQPAAPFEMPLHNLMFALSASSGGYFRLLLAFADSRRLAMDNIGSVEVASYCLSEIEGVFGYLNSANHHPNLPDILHPLAGRAYSSMAAAFLHAAHATAAVARQEKALELLALFYEEANPGLKRDFLASASASEAEATPSTTAPGVDESVLKDLDDVEDVPFDDSAEEESPDSATSSPPESLSRSTGVYVCHLRVADALNDLGNCYTLARAYHKAATLYHTSAAIRKRHISSLPPITKSGLWADHPDLASSQLNLGIVAAHVGTVSESEQILNDSIKQFRRLYGLKSQQYCMAIVHFTSFLYNAKKLRAAEDILKKALGDIGAVLPPAHRTKCDLLINLAAVLEERGHPAEALAYRREVLSICRGRRSPHNRAEISAAHEHLALNYAAQKVWPEAVAQFRECLQCRIEDNVPATSPQYYSIKNWIDHIESTYLSSQSGQWWQAVLPVDRMTAAMNTLCGNR